MPAVLADTTERLLSYLPPIKQGSYDIQAMLDAAGRELDRLDAEIANVRDNFFPQTGQDYLFLWEQLLGLTVSPPDKSTAQRISTILARRRALLTSGSGLDWEAALTRLIGTGWDYNEYDPLDSGSPPPYSVRIYIPYADALADPSGLAGTAFAAGGTLASATYRYRVTALNTFGETAPSSEISKVVTGPTGRVVLTWGAVTGATSYNVFRNDSYLASAATNGYTDDGSVAVDPLRTYPMQNTTKSAQAYEAEQLARAITPAHLDLIFSYQQGFILGVSQVGEETL